MTRPASSLHRGFTIVRITAGAAGTYPGPTMRRAMRVIRAWGLMTIAGAASFTGKITNGTNDITEAKDLSAVADKAVFDWTIDDAYMDLAVGAIPTVVAVTTACQFEAFLMLVPADAA